MHDDLPKTPRQWPHAPPHWLFEPGTYFVTGSTYKRTKHFLIEERRDFLLNSLLTLTEEFGWSLRAWVVMSNHYHFLSVSPNDPDTLRKMLGKLHMETAKELNLRDGTPGRQVWYQFRETHITYEKSFLARLNYIHINPIKHEMAEKPEDYRWSSATWFRQTASKSFVETVSGFKTDQLRIPDDY